MSLRKTLEANVTADKNSFVGVRAGSSESNGNLPLVTRTSCSNFVNEERRLKGRIRRTKHAEGRLYNMRKGVKLPPISLQNDGGRLKVESGKCEKTEITRSRSNNQSGCKRTRARLTNFKLVSNAGEKPGSGKKRRALKRNHIKRLSDSLGILRLDDEVQTYNLCVREASLDIRRIELSPRGGSSRANKPLGRLKKESNNSVLKDTGNSSAELLLLKNTKERNAKSEPKISQGTQRNSKTSFTPMYPNFDLTPLEEQSLGNLSPTSLVSSEESLDDWRQEPESQLFRFSPSPPAIDYLEKTDPQPAFPTLQVTSMTLSASNLVPSSPCFSDVSLDSFYEESYALSPLPPSELSSQSELSENFYNIQDKQGDIL